MIDTSEIIMLFLAGLFGCIGMYIFGVLFTKGALSEIHKYLEKQLHIFLKAKENGKEEKK